jgi:hypothetical protein
VAASGSFFAGHPRPTLDISFRYWQRDERQKEFWRLVMKVGDFYDMHHPTAASSAISRASAAPSSPAPAAPAAAAPAAESAPESFIHSDSSVNPVAASPLPAALDTLSPAGGDAVGVDTPAPRDVLPDGVLDSPESALCHLLRTDPLDGGAEIGQHW